MACVGEPVPGSAVRRAGISHSAFVPAFIVSGAKPETAIEPFRKLVRCRSHARKYTDEEKTGLGVGCDSDHSCSSQQVFRC